MLQKIIQSQLKMLSFPWLKQFTKLQIKIPYNIEKVTRVFIIFFIISTCINNTERTLQIVFKCRYWCRYHPALIIYPLKWHWLRENVTNVNCSTDEEFLFLNTWRTYYENASSIPYQPWSCMDDICVSAWYGMWYGNCHVYFYLSNLNLPHNTATVPHRTFPLQ